MRHDCLIIAALFVLVPCLVLNWSVRSDSVFDGILARVRHECDPANPEADFQWSQRSMPTEKKREAIIEDCRKLGAVVLPDVRKQLEREDDYEVHGMLVVIAAALGDKGALDKAARLMVWSDFPAVRISAARTLSRLRDRRTYDWFVSALDDEHFVVNGGCGSLREKFYPVRAIAQITLREMNAHRAGDKLLPWGAGLLDGMTPSESLEERMRRIRDDRMRELEARVEAELRLRKVDKR